MILNMTQPDENNVVTFARGHVEQAEGHGQYDGGLFMLSGLPIVRGQKPGACWLQVKAALKVGADGSSG
jgi:hypothetical protein